MREGAGAGEGSTEGSIGPVGVHRGGGGAIQGVGSLGDALAALIVCATGDGHFVWPAAGSQRQIRQMGLSNASGPVRNLAQFF